MVLNERLLYAIYTYIGRNQKREISWWNLGFAINPQGPNSTDFRFVLRQEFLALEIRDIPENQRRSQKYRRKLCYAGRKFELRFTIDHG